MRQFNHQDRDFKNRVSLRSAPFADSSPKVAAYAQMISERTQANRKILYFFEGSKLPGYLLGHTAEETDKPAANYPPLAALGYAVAELIFKEPMDLRIFNQKPITDWDPLNH
ncbi:MAG: hypothetical protein L6277_10485 [Desulfobacterales bacterium]|nr:hypothetical protein [Desulfobacterales bacterium]